MKKISFAIITALVILALAQPALALDFSKIEVKLSKSINKDCVVGDGYDPVWSCFMNDYRKVPGQAALVPTPVIYMRPDVPAPLLPYAFLSSVGQYVAMPYSDQELAMVFNPVPDQMDFQDVRRAAANSFAFWAMGGTLPTAKVEFFRQAFMK